MHSAFQLRCPDFLSCHSLDVPADAEPLCNKNTALGTTIKETPYNTHTAMWHKHRVRNNFKKCDTRYHSAFLNDAGVQAVPLLAWTGHLGVPGGWGSQNFYTIGTWKWQGCQPYAPASFTPRINAGSQNFYTIGTWRWQGCQPYAPASFTPRINAGSQNFYTIGTWRWQGCQPYAPDSFTPRTNAGTQNFYTISTWRWQGCQPYAPTSFIPRINAGVTSIYGNKKLWFIKKGAN